VLAFKPQALGLVQARVTGFLSAEQSPLQNASYLQLLIYAVLSQTSIVDGVQTDTTSYPVSVSTRLSLSSPDASLRSFLPFTCSGERAPLGSLIIVCLHFKVMSDIVSAQLLYGI
jgi:hypothetical protein